MDFQKDLSSKYNASQLPLFSDAMELYRQRVQSNSSLKGSSKHYRDICIEKIKNSWPGVLKLRLGEITPMMCRDWAAGLQSQIAPQYFNNVIDTMRLILQEGIESHIQSGGTPVINPAENVSRARITPRALELPERDQFASLIKTIRDGSSWGNKAANLLEFLAYSGMRLYTEAQWVTWEDVDWNRKEIIVRGDPVTHTKNWEVRRIPILSNMEDLLKRIRNVLVSEPKPSDKIMEITECPISLHKACK